jgi:hypothetical protein
MECVSSGGSDAALIREVLSFTVGNSEAKGYWHQRPGSFKERGLNGNQPVISDAKGKNISTVRQWCVGFSASSIHGTAKRHQMETLANDLPDTEDENS